MKIKVCPNCGNPDIEYASMSVESGSLVGIGLPENYYCSNCGYKGAIILEIPKEKLKAYKFPKKAWHEKKTRKKDVSVEAVKPVFIFILLLFFFVVFALMIPKYDVTTEPEDFDSFAQGSTTYYISGKEIVITESGEYVKEGDKYLRVKESSLQYVDNALGLQNVSGFLLPTFFLFFIAGFIALMVYGHWHRVKLFA